MICQVCNAKEAKLHITQIIDSQKYSLHACHDCANEHGISGAFGSKPLLIKDFVPGAKSIPIHAVPNEEGTNAEVNVHDVCPKCGLSYSVFRETGKFGCSNCYLVFHERVKPLLKRVQKDIQHCGKTPQAENPIATIRRQLSNKRVQLKQAIVAEDFETAAKRRDEIHDLEKKIAESPENYSV